MTDLITFQTFSTFQEASEMKEILLKDGIQASILKATQVFDAVLVGGSTGDMYELKMDGSDFVKAREILYNSPKFKIDDVGSDHPLYEMANDELQDIISKADEWGPENYNVALFLLKKRGVSLSDETINKLQDERNVVLSEKKPMPGYVLVLGYLPIIMPFVGNAMIEHEKDGKILWYFPGIIGLLISWVILQSKMTLPDGRRVQVYSNRIMMHGLIMFGLNILSWLINFLLFADKFF